MIKRFSPAIRLNKRYLSLIITIAYLLLILPANASAQDTPRVHIESGFINPGEAYWYSIPNLKAGQKLSVNLRGTSGNLDPIMGLIASTGDAAAVTNDYRSAIQDAIVNGDDPIIAAATAADNLFLIWDDDSGDGLSAAFSYEIPQDGDYQLIVSNALNFLGQATFGGYELAAALDAPSGFSLENAVPNGEPLLFLDRQASAAGILVEEFIGVISADQPQKILNLHDRQVGDVISVYVEALSTTLKPELALINYAGKPLRIENVNGESSSASLDYTVGENNQGLAVRITGCCEDDFKGGDFRLLVGVNDPDVLTGDAPVTSNNIIKEPIPVQVGVKLQQIVEVDEQNEFFNAVASIQMEWEDPTLAFSPDECNCTFRTYTDKDFAQFEEDAGNVWPEFTLYNQQGNRWTQNRVAVVWQDGRALYFERFSTNFQVDFDFRKYPFDDEDFLIVVDSIFPENFYYFTDLEGYSEISPDHGEDEFIIDDFRTEISSEQASTLSTTSRFSFIFGGPRHLDYYIFQIFIPIVLILGVLWVTFFLRDYALRIEVAGANLLVFIAFSFSLADNYPRLGYLTLLDATMVLTFGISALVIIYNVFLRRLELNNKADFANRIDNYFDWIYPGSIILGVVILYLLFFK